MEKITFRNSYKKWKWNSKYKIWNFYPFSFRLFSIFSTLHVLRPWSTTVKSKLMVGWYDEGMHRWTAFCFVIWKTGYFFFICENGSLAKDDKKRNSCKNSMFHIHLGINGNLMTLIDYVHWRWCISLAFSFRLRRMESTDGRAWVFSFILFLSSTFQANVFLVQSNGLFASLKWFFLFIHFFVFTSASHSIIAFRLRSYLELDYTFGFIWIFVLSIFNQRFTCRPFAFFLVCFFFAVFICYMMMPSVRTNGSLSPFLKWLTADRNASCNST